MFLVCVNSQHLLASWLAKLQGIICVSTKCWGSYDVTGVFLEDPGVYLGPGI